MNPQIALWIYIALLLLGGLIGFVTAKSLISLIMSAAFGLLLGLCAGGVIPQPIVVDLLLAALLGVFMLRLAKTRKFMPAGFMLGLTAIMLVLMLAFPLPK